MPGLGVEAPTEGDVSPVGVGRKEGLILTSGSLYCRYLLDSFPFFQGRVGSRGHQGPGAGAASAHTYGVTSDTDTPSVSRRRPVFGEVQGHRWERHTNKVL